MRIKDLADRGHAETLVTSCDFGELANAFQRILNGSRGFGYRLTFAEGCVSTIAFFHEFVEGAVPLPGSGNEAGSITRSLLALSNTDQALYPDKLRENAKRGWRIRKARMNHMPVAIAEAAWV